MCGRATLITPVEEIAAELGVDPIPLRGPRFNMAPGQPIPVVRLRVAPAEGRELALLRWGLVPSWARDPKMGGRCVQARAETVATAPAYRAAFRARRCLLVVDGFFEWKSLAGGRRQPHHVRRREGGVFALAGIWEGWATPEGGLLETCAVVTTEAVGVVRELHDRMPLVVPRAERDQWLAGSPSDARELTARAPTLGGLDLVIVPVSTWVNDVKHDEPRCVAPLEGTELSLAPEPQLALGFK